MDFEKVCNNIFEIDDKIRFAAVYDDQSKKIAGGMRKGMKSYLSEELTELSIEGAFTRWKTRKNLREWLGDPIYSLAEYKKIKRFTFYITPKKILVVSTERDADNNKITVKIPYLL